MQRRNILRGLALGFAALLIAILSLDFSRYTPQIIALLTNQARASGVSLRLSNPTLSGLTLSAPMADIFLQKAHTSLQISDLALSVKALPLLGLDVQAELSGTLYGGRLSASSSFSPFNQRGSGWLTLTQAQISQHPYGALFGISGEIELSAKNIEFDHALVNDGQINLQIRGGHKDAESAFNLKPLGINFSIQIPKFSNLSLTALALIKPNAIRLTLTQLSSSLFSIAGDGTLHRSDSGKLERIQWEGAGTIEPEGSKVFGGFLPLISQGQLDAESTNFRIKISGVPHKPKVELFR